MKLNLIDKLTLLSLDDEKGTFLSDAMYFSYSIAGAIVLELTLKDNIEIINKKLVVKNKKNTDDKILNTYLNLMVKSKKEKSLSHLFQTLCDKASAIRKETIKKLIRQGILTRKEKKFLWIFSFNRFPAINSAPENELRNRLCNILENNKEPSIKEIMLISLIDSCNLNKQVFGKEKAKIYKEKIRTIIKNTKTTNTINKTIKEVHDLINATIVILISTTMLTTTINN